MRDALLHLRAALVLGWSLVPLAAHVARAQDAQPAAPPASPSPAPEAAPAPAQPPAPAAAPAVESAAPPEVVQAPADANPPAAVVEAPGTSLFDMSAEEAATQTAEPGASAAAEPPFALGGYVRGDMFIGKVPGYSQPLFQANYAELALQLSAEAERWGKAYAEARMRAGLSSEERDLDLDLREAYVDAYLGPLDLRLGQQIIVWGRADAFNPTNNLTPLDLRVRSPVEDDRRVGNVGARAFLNLMPVRIEGVWLPVYEPTLYPPLDLDEFIALGAPDFPAPELENGLYALRVHLELPAFELSGSFLHGFAPLPGFALRDFTVGVDPPEVRVARTAYEQNVAGFDFSTAIGEALAIRGEAAYRHPVDWENEVYAPRPDLQYVLGLDRAFGSVNVIVQYMGRYVFDWTREDGPEDPIEPAALVRFMAPLPASLRSEITESIDAELAQRNQILFSQTARVQHLATVRVEWLTLQDTLSLSALAMVNFTTEEWLLFPKLGYRISDALSAYLGAELYAGPSGTLFDLIDEDLSAGYVELRVSF